MQMEGKSWKLLVRQTLAGQRWVQGEKGERSTNHATLSSYSALPCITTLSPDDTLCSLMRWSCITILLHFIHLIHLIHFIHQLARPQCSSTILLPHLSPSSAYFTKSDIYRKVFFTGTPQFQWWIYNGAISLQELLSELIFPDS